MRLTGPLSDRFSEFRATVPWSGAAYGRSDFRFAGTSFTARRKHLRESGRFHHAPNQLARIDVQRSSKQEDNAESRLVPATFEQRGCGAVEVGQFGEALLRQPAFLARLSQNLTEHLSDRSRDRAVGRSWLHRIGNVCAEALRRPDEAIDHPPDLGRDLAVQAASDFVVLVGILPVYRKT